MIVAEQKPIDELIRSLEGFKKIVIASCGTCVTVCMSGGEKEALAVQGLLEANAKEKGQDISVSVVDLKRQCDDEFIDDLEAELLDGDVVLSMACGVGVQFLAGKYADKVVLPGLNTTFYGAAKELGYWTELCAGCGNCLLERTGGICPIARCSKSIFNGPCGGSQNAKCEIDSEIDCAWQLIYDKLTAMGRLDTLLEIHEIRDWSTSRDGGPRHLRKDDVNLDDAGK
ncbi:MAG: methylenetetrahydrofolate reductase C-terminal domain-containing protein [Clostridiales bacterium]|nr:methylenetetrahydrofolate reductase C-terminal domain-containing protein [Clostridiales bacterium]